MTDDQALTDGGAGPGVPVVDVEVGAADAGVEDADLYVVDAHLGLGDVLKPEAAFVMAFYECLHGECLSCLDANRGYLGLALRVICVTSVYFTRWAYADGGLVRRCSVISYD